jgi:hypothetical protein
MFYSSAMPEEMHPDIEAIVDKYPLSDFILPSGSLNRTLGAQALTELSDTLKRINGGQRSDTYVPLANEGAFISHSYNVDPPDKRSEESGQQEPREIKVEPDRLTALFTVLFACHLELDHPITQPSNQIVRSPGGKLDVRQQMRHYFGYNRARQQAGMDTFESAAAQLGEPLHPTDNLRTIVAIPVAGHQEHGNIYRTLTQFGKQDMDPSQYEINLSVNLPVTEEESDISDDEVARLAASLRNTIDEIKRFQNEHPHVPVRYYTQAYQGAAPIIGKIRSDLWAATALDLQRRGLDHDVLVISADADTVSLNSQYLSEMAKTFETTGADLVAAKLLWQMAPDLPADAPVNRFLRYQTFLDIIRDNASDYKHTADANTGISLATYLAVGGYNRQAELGEMRDIVHRILYYRRVRGKLEVPQIVQQADGARLRSHSRRLITAMALGHSPYHAWNQDLIKFGGHDSLRTDELRSSEANRQTELHYKEWIAEITPSYTEFVEPDKLERMLRAAHKILGFEDVTASFEELATANAYELSQAA